MIFEYMIVGLLMMGVWMIELILYPITLLIKLWDKIVKGK